MGVPEKRYRYRRDSHGSNVEHTMRIRIKCTGMNALPGKPEHALGGYLEKTKSLMNSCLHTFKLLPLTNEEDRGPLWEDGDFREDAELKHYVSAEEKMENRATKSFEIYVECSYAGLGNAPWGMNTTSGGIMGEYLDMLQGMMLTHHQREENESGTVTQKMTSNE